MYAIKEAVIAKEHSPDIEPTIFFMDMRAFGKDFDKYYERARDEYGVRFVRSRVARIDEGENGQLDLLYVTEDEHYTREAFDLVVLSVGLEPSKGTRALVEKLGLRDTDEGFCHVDEFRPLDSSRKGIYVCGAASGPKDIPETVVQASGAAAEAGRLLAPLPGSRHGWAYLFATAASTSPARWTWKRWRLMRPRCLMSCMRDATCLPARRIPKRP